MKVSVCQYILSRCSAKLETHSLNTKLTVNEGAIETQADGGEPLTRLRELEICLFDGGQISRLSSFLGRCQHIERLVLLVYYLLELCVFRRPHSITILSDKSFATLLSACHGNLRIVDATNTAVFGELSCKALPRHSSTLEKLNLERWSSSGSTHLKQILTSCPRLHALGTLSYGDCEILFVSSINAWDLMDLDQDSNILKPWPCEPTLKVFKAKITNIPRPDITYDVYHGPRLSVAKETYPGEGRVIQRRVYERLARFSNLETLWLGHVAHRVTGTHLHLETEAGYTGLDEEMPLHYDADNQCDYLEMSLQGGLGQLV